MFTNSRICTIILASVIFGLSVPAHAGEFLDTRITFTIGDDNFFKSAGEQIPNSPLFGVSDRLGYATPMESLDSASSGRENELHIVLYKRVEGIFPGLVTEVAATMEIDLTELEARDPKLYNFFSDDSSYIRLQYAIDPGKTGDQYIDLVLFPLSGDRFRAGYLYDLSWGGNSIFPKRKGPMPAFKLGGNHGKFYWWSGMKFVVAPTEPEGYMKEDKGERYTSEWETLYSVLGGVGAQPLEGLSIDLSGGYMQIARNPVPNVPDLIVSTNGFSARIAYGRGLKVGLSSDLKLVRNDPEYLEALSKKPTYSPGSGLSWRVSAEGNAIVQVLADPDHYAASKRQWATAAALDFRLQYNYLRANFVGVYRSLAFSLLGMPSMPSYRAFPEESTVDPQIFFALSADYHFPKLHLTPGIQAGVELPSAMSTQWNAYFAGTNPLSSMTGKNTVLFPSNSTPVILAEGKERLPVYSARLTARWYPSDILTIMAFMLFIYDSNASVLEVNADAQHKYVYDEPFRLGAGITAQARF